MDLIHIQHLVFPSYAVSDITSDRGHNHPSGRYILSAFPGYVEDCCYCPTWLPRTPDGYLTISGIPSALLRPISITASRGGFQLLSWLLSRREFAAHGCGNASCVRQDHIYPATHSENMLDRALHEGIQDRPRLLPSNSPSRVAPFLEHYSVNVALWSPPIMSAGAPKGMLKPVLPLGTSCMPIAEELKPRLVTFQIYVWKSHNGPISASLFPQCSVTNFCDTEGCIHPGHLVLFIPDTSAVMNGYSRDGFELPAKIRALCVAAALVMRQWEAGT